MDVVSVSCQQFNVNDSTYAVLEKFCKNGDKVKRNDIVLMLDSSKAALDIESEGEGFFYTNVNVGEHVKVGQVLYIVTKEELTDQAAIDSFFAAKQETETSGEGDTAKIITKSAKKLMALHQLKESDFSEEVITEEVIHKYLDTAKQSVSLILEPANVKGIKRIALIGAGKGLVQVLDIIFNLPDYIPVHVYDDTPEKQGISIFNIPVKGKVNLDAIADDYKNGQFDLVVNTVSVSIEFRKKVFSTLSAAGVPFANLVHPAAYVGFNNSMGQGNVIFAHVSMGPCTQIGNDNFISARCNIEHHNVLGSHCTFGPGVMTSGSVTIGDEVKFGTGVFIEPKLIIGSKSIIASGSIVTRNIDAAVLAYPHGAKLAFKNLTN